MHMTLGRIMLEINITDINALYILCYTLNHDKKSAKNISWQW